MRRIKVVVLITLCLSLGESAAVLTRVRPAEAATLKACPNTFCAPYEDYCTFAQLYECYLGTSLGICVGDVLC